ALANWLVGNPSEAAAVETAYAAIRLRARADCTVAVHGSATQVEIGGRTFGTESTLHLKTGDELRVPAPASGCGSYVAVSGGLNVDPALDATSTYAPAKLGGIDGSTLKSGVILRANDAPSVLVRTLPDAFKLRHSSDFLLRIVAAPESDWIDPASLIGQNWLVGRRGDRIGLELEGSALEPLRTTQLESSAVFPGTIQCPPSGLPFLLGPDAQTTGGYPRIAQIVRADRHLIGQLRPGAHVRFQRIEPAEARRLYRSKIALIRQLQPDFRLD
ncbi:MAG TPA: biotin-dependent carboxyltransferase family protein, partial [Sphingorhabdus sp.]|nr:biotin-dependent carboxyltransferase family protein [Sphingorhabdus sp.]